MDVLIRFPARPLGSGRRVLGSLTRDAVRETLRLAGAPETAETSVLYVDDAEMRRLNETYRGVPRATDVLTFAMREGEPDPVPARHGPETELLGDIVISLETAARQAAGRSPRREIALLLIHGTLHLLGYEHTGAGSGAKARVMRALEKKCLENLEALLIL